MNNIAEQHERLYTMLLKEHPDLTFSLRQDNRDGMLEKGYWFDGDEVEIRFSFWKSDTFKTPFIYFKWRLDKKEIILCIDGRTPNNTSPQQESDVMVFIEKMCKQEEFKKNIIKENSQ